MKFLITLCLSVFALNVFAQLEGTAFPDMETETVDDKVINLPIDTQDKYTLLALAYSKKAEKDLTSWFSPVYNKFIKEATGVFASFSYDINVYFVPMFTGVKAAATGTAKRKTAEELDPLLIPNILFYKGSLKPYKDALEFDKKDVPYLFLVDKEGKIAYATSGEYTDEKMEAMEEFLDSL
ncbi:MAG: hypothetical protein RLO81_15890 [Fulvivirga sp.]|uniref:hypothetical protein n=1 Tax=Fulvivirga sp. TaxID=1931237 RepID=UPI0032EBACA9